MTPVDTTGAGDTFAGVLAACLDEGADLATAMAPCRGRRLARLHQARRPAELPDPGGDRGGGDGEDLDVLRFRRDRLHILECHAAKRPAPEPLPPGANRAMPTTTRPSCPCPACPTAPRAPRVLRLHPDDNLVVSIDPILPGAIAEGVTAVARVPKGHKMATVEIAEGEPVLKFGQIIGFAKAAIRPGEHIHEHNCGVHDFARDYQFAEAAEPEHVLPVEQRRTFEGYKRPERQGRHPQLYRHPDHR